MPIARSLLASTAESGKGRLLMIGITDLDARRR